MILLYLVHTAGRGEISTYPFAAQQRNATLCCGAARLASAAYGHLTATVFEFISLTASISEIVSIMHQAFQSHCTEGFLCQTPQILACALHTACHC